jgi:hypothetical protein
MIPGGKSYQPNFESVHNRLHGRPVATGGSYEEADKALKGIKEHLNRSRISMQQRRAYLVEPGEWIFNTATKRIEINEDYFASMSAGSSFAFNADSEVLESRPNIQAEFVTVFEPGLTREFIDEFDSGVKDGKKSRLEVPEGTVKRFRDSNKNRGMRSMRIVQARSLTEHIVELAENDEDITCLEECDPRSQMLWFEQNDYVLRKKRDFVERLHTQPDEHHLPLKSLFKRDYKWSEPKDPDEELDWIDRDLKDAASDGTKEQRAFVKRALASDDFTFVWGPAGSGKTTAICEFVRQCVQRGERVLMVASTHVAVDNVLLKLMSPARSGLKEVIPVRVGRGEKVDPKVRPRMLDQFLLDEIGSMLRSLTQAEKNRSAETSAQLMRKSLRKLDERLRSRDQRAEHDPLAKLILSSANFVCGTSLGILQHPTIKGGMEGGDYPVWDHLILDEASKTTIDEFLVPALCARRWIIVGDPYQLAPYCDNGEIGSGILSDLTAPPKKSKDDDAGGHQAGKIPDEIKKLTAQAIQRALDERSARLGGGIHHEEARAEYDNSLRKLRHAAGQAWANIPDRLEEVLKIVTPSVLESLFSDAGREDALPSLLPPFPDDARLSRMVRLEYQHRMDRRIAEFCRHHVYAGKQLITARHVQRPHLYGAEHERLVLLEESPSVRSLLETIPSSGHSQESARQVALALHEVMAFAESFKDDQQGKSSYVISTYRRQNLLVRKVLEHINRSHPDIWRGLTVSANTVDSCQGHEADLVVLTMVRDHQTPFMRSTNRMNVAFTRAKSKLVVIGPLPAMTRQGKTNDADRTLLDCLHGYEHLTRSQCLGSERLELAVRLTVEALRRHE